MVNFINKKIDVSISVIRLISLIMIISCHILQYLGYEAAFWVNLGVQVFFFISGFLYGNKDIKNAGEFYKDKIKKILLPYMLLVIIVYIAERMFIKSSYSKIFLIGNLMGFQAFSGSLKIIPHTWFVSYILICYLITPILQKIFENNKNVTKKLLMIILFIQLTSYYKVTNIKAPWIVNYILGYVYTRYYNKYSKKEKMFNICIISIALITLPIRIILQYKLGDIQFPAFVLKNTDLIKQYSHVLLGSSLFIILYKFCNIIKLKRYNVILKLSDKYSYYIYLVHQIFILRDFSLMKLTDSLVINILVIFIVSFLSGIALYYMYKIIIKLFSKIVIGFRIIKRKIL